MSVIAESTVLAPFEIWSVPLDEHRSIKFNEPLILTPMPVPDDPEEPSEPGENNYLLVEYPDLNISTFADNRDDLLEFVKSDIRFTWRHIVRIPPAELDRESVQIKCNYLRLAEEVYG